MTKRRKEAKRWTDSQQKCVNKKGAQRAGHAEANRMHGLGRTAREVDLDYPCNKNLNAPKTVQCVATAAKRSLHSCADVTKKRSWREEPQAELSSMLMMRISGS